MIDPVIRGIRIKQWLEDEAVMWAMDELKRANYESFLSAKTTEELIGAQARQQAFEAFAQTLRAIVGEGEMEQHKREHPEQNATER